MKKIFVLSVVFITLLLGVGSSSANAGGCDVTCRWSKCKVGGCDMWACGCYFGIASCKCETRTIASPNSANIRDFGDFARNSRMAGLMSISGLLNSLTESTDYNAFFIAYQSQVESLNAQERRMLIAYLGGEY